MLRLSNYSDNTNRKIKDKQQEKLLRERTSMKQSPTISPTSRDITKNRT